MNTFEANKLFTSHSDIHHNHSQESKMKTLVFFLLYPDGSELMLNSSVDFNAERRTKNAKIVHKEINNNCTL